MLNTLFLAYISTYSWPSPQSPSNSGYLGNIVYRGHRSAGHKSNKSTFKTIQFNYEQICVWGGVGIPSHPSLTSDTQYLVLHKARAVV